MRLWSVKDRHGREWETHTNPLGAVAATEELGHEYPSEAPFSIAEVEEALGGGGQ